MAHAADPISLNEKHDRHTLQLVGRGRIPWDSNTVRKWCAGSPPPEARNAHCLIRRNHFVLEV